MSWTEAPTQTGSTVLVPAPADHSTTARTLLTYRSVDNLGHIEADKTTTVLIDTTGPGGSGNVPNLVSGTVTLTVSPTDSGSGIKSVQFQVDGTNVGPALTASPYSYDFDSTTVADGNHAFTAVVTDNLDNTGTIDLGTNMVDNNDPTGSLTSPADGSTVSGTVTITATADDGTGSGVQSVKFTLDGTTLLTDTTAPYAAQWNSKGSADGSHTLGIVVTDNAGRTSSSSVTVTSSNPVSSGGGGNSGGGHAAPKLVSSSPSEGQAVASLSQDSLTFDENLASASATLDGNPATLLSSGPTVTALISGPLAAGAHALTVTVTDSAGSSTTVTVHFAVTGAAGSDPAPTSVVIQPGQSQVLTCSDGSCKVTFPAGSYAGAVIRSVDPTPNVSTSERASRSADSATTSRLCSAATPCTTSRRRSTSSSPRATRRWSR